MKNKIRTVNLSKLKTEQLTKLVGTFLKVLNNHTTLEVKYIRNNQDLFVSKQLRNAVMKRSKLLNKHESDTSTFCRLVCKKQSNCCVELLRKVRWIFIIISWLKMLLKIDSSGKS